MSPADSTANSTGLLLVVDDQPCMANYMRLVLSRDGYDIATAFNAEEAWALFRREAPRVQAVVTDIRMPGGLDGLELAGRVREIAPDTPVLLVTGYVPSGPLGPNCSLLLKPLSADALRAAVRRMVNAASSLAAADAGARCISGPDGGPRPHRKPTAILAARTDQPNHPA